MTLLQVIAIAYLLSMLFAWLWVRAATSQDSPREDDDYDE